MIFPLIDRANTMPPGVCLSMSKYPELNALRAAVDRRRVIDLVAE
jgi:hypothetical protein